MTTAEEMSTSYTTIINSINKSLELAQDPQEIKLLLADYNAARSAYLKLVGSVADSIDPVVHTLSTQLIATSAKFNEGLKDIAKFQDYLQNITVAVGLLAKLAVIVMAA